MAKIRNVSGRDLHLLWLNNRLVLAGSVVDVPDGDVYNYTCQTSNWQPADKKAEGLHADGAKAEAARIEDERRSREEPPTNDLVVDEAAPAERAAPDA